MKLSALRKDVLSLHFKVSKLTVFLLVLLVFLMSSQTVFASEIEDSKERIKEIEMRITELENEKEQCSDLKIKAHQAAEFAREKGLLETGEIISRAGLIWETNDIREKEINSEIVELKEELKEYEMFSKMSYIGDFRLTGYCACKKCCGKSPSNPNYGRTAMGTMATEGRTIAMDKRFAFGTKVYIEGLGIRTVEDRGGAIKGNRIDVYSSTHQGCYAPEFNRTAKVYIINE